MTKKMWTSILILSLLFVEVAPAQVQQEKRFKRAMATIIFSSLGGAILGLSTLSFYGEPEQHANNISSGAVLGFAVGVGYVLLDTAPAPKRKADDYVFSEIEMFNRAKTKNESVRPLFQVAFDF